MIVPCSSEKWCCTSNSGGGVASVGVHKAGWRWRPGIIDCTLDGGVGRLDMGTQLARYSSNSSSSMLEKSLMAGECGCVLSASMACGFMMQDGWMNGWMDELID